MVGKLCSIQYLKSAGSRQERKATYLTLVMGMERRIASCATSAIKMRHGKPHTQHYSLRLEERWSQNTIYRAINSRKKCLLIIWPVCVMKAKPLLLNEVYKLGLWCPACILLGRGLVVCITQLTPV